MSVRIVNWRRALEENWSNLRFGEVTVASDTEKHLFDVQVYLNGLDPDSVRVELYADGINGGDPVRQEMTRGQQLVGANGYVYRSSVPASRPAMDFTARVIPHHPGASVPLEAVRILWQR
jgi:starch phosphorylase